MGRIKKHWRRWVLIGLALDCVALLFNHRLFGASNITIAKAESLEKLDGSPLDADGSANGLFTVGGKLTLAPGGRLTCGRLSSGGGPCAVRIATGGDLEMQARSEIVSTGGSGAGPIEIAVGGNFTMRGGAAGARITASDATASGGAIDIYVVGKAVAESGSSISSDAAAEGGQIAITAADTDIRGAVSARAARPGSIALAKTSDSPRS